MQTKTKIKLTSLGATVFIMVLSNTILIPIFPEMRQALGVSMVQVSMLVVAVNVPAAIISPIGGFLADLWGRKAVIIPSLAIYGLGGLIAGIVGIYSEDPYNLILFARVLQGIGSAAPMFLAITLAGDIFQSSERSEAVGLMETASGTGKILGPILGSLVGILSWYSPFFIYPLVSIPTAIAVYYLIEPVQPSGQQMTRDYSALFKVLKQGVFLIGFVISFISLYILFGLMFWLSESFEENIQAGAILRGIVVSLPVIAFLLTTLFAEWFYLKYKVKKTLLIGLGLTILFVAMVPLVDDWVFIWPVIFLAGVGVGVLMPALDTLFTSIQASQRGVMTTIFGSIRSLGVAGGTSSFAYLMPLGTEFTFWLISAIVLVVLIIVIVLFKENAIPERNENID